MEVPPQPARPVSEAFLAAIVESSDDAIFTKDLNGIITSWNASAERLFGYTASEVVGRPVTILFPPDRLAEENFILGRIRRGERVHHFETIRRAKDGRLIEVSLSISPVRDGSGRIVGAAKIARDITAQKRAQEQFRLTLASIGDAVIATDVAGRVTFINAVAERLTGWSASEAVGQPLTVVFHIVAETTGAVAESPVARVIREGVVVGLANHTILISRDGQRRPIDDSAAPIRTVTGGLIGVVLVFRDVSDRYAAQLATQRLAAIVEGSNDAIISKDLNGIVTTWNPAAERIFGYTAHEMIGRPVSTLFPPDRLQEEPEIMERLQRGERVEHFETIRLRKDGEQLNVSLTISPIRDTDGKIIGASKIARDITAQKAVERALQEAQQKLSAHASELEEKVGERTMELQRLADEAQAFSYSFSHDIRAPLRAIEGFSEVLLSDFGDKIPEAVEYLQRIIRAARRMDRLLADVLAFSKASHREITVEPVELGPIVQDIILERRHLQAPAARVEIAEPLARVTGDVTSLQQALTNLLENAVKFIAPGVEPRIRVFTQPRERFVRVCVQDNGIGITPENQARLFAVFQRLPTKDKYEGTGLGLAIVRRAAERMGGTAGVESEPGKGSTFWIELPRVE